LYFSDNPLAAFVLLNPLRKQISSGFGIFESEEMSGQYLFVHHFEMIKSLFIVFFDIFA